MPTYTFGPVPSRRLGRSLGVDLVPLKTCSLNCIYCQLGRTNSPTIQRAEYAPVEEVLRQVKARLDEGADPDFITLAGSGEPTLHSGIGRIIAGIKAFTDVPVSVLTNGALFSDPAVRRDCLDADVIMPSFDAGDEETFRRLNRPHPSITVAGLAEGITKLREEYKGKIWLEVFLVEGVNATEEHCRKLRAYIDRMRPDRIDLNTAVRPTTEPDVRRVSPERMEELRPLFGPKAVVVADYDKVAKHTTVKATPDSVFALLDRRPCTMADIVAGLGAEPTEVVRAVDMLLKLRRIVADEQAGKTYYKPKV